MTNEPNIRQRALLPGISASAWANLFAVAVIGLILAIILLGVASDSSIPLARPASLGFAFLVLAAAVLAGIKVFVRITAERKQGYTTIDGFRVGAGVSMLPGAPDVVDTVESRTGVVLRDAGEIAAAPELIAARMLDAKRRIRSGERPILLDPLR
ncbi:hypothetical protein HQQ80_16170 [Microbacteriaceae bacterium VKM Ac-2855]|nr:hypothetical protein [Microbacteriaceae bacterium VKM Ac-2855]